MMDVLRRHAFFIVCGGVAVLGIALGALGFAGMSDVQTLLEADKALYANLSGVQSGAVNEDRIKIEERRIARTRADRDRVMEQARKLAPYEQLVPGFFPKAAQDKHKVFREAYIAALNKLLVPFNEKGKETDPLRWGMRATPDIIEFWEGQVKREQAGKLRDPGPGEKILEAVGPRFDERTWALRPEAAAIDKNARANMDAAQKCYLYASRWDVKGDRPPSLVVERDVFITNRIDRLDPALLWRAQLQVWIYRDVIEAIRRLNDESAKKFLAAPPAGSRQDAPWVGVMPVKELISIRVSDYLKPDDEKVEFNGWGRAEREDPAVPAGSHYPTFTKSTCTDLYDVVQFSVKLVMDQRDVLRFVDELTRERFHTLLRLSYVPTTDVFDRTCWTTVFGSDPIVNVLFDFEAVMPAEQYRRHMPDEVLEFIGFERPVPPEAAGKSGEAGA